MDFATSSGECTDFCRADPINAEGYCVGCEDIVYMGINLRTTKVADMSDEVFDYVFKKHSVKLKRHFCFKLKDNASNFLAYIKKFGRHFMKVLNRIKCAGVSPSITMMFHTLLPPKTIYSLASFSKHHGLLKDFYAFFNDANATIYNFKGCPLKLIKEQGQAIAPDTMTRIPDLYERWTNVLGNAAISIENCGKQQGG